MRLVDSREEDGVTVGTPQVFHAGAWGSFCSGDVGIFDYNDDLTEVILLTLSCDGPTSIPAFQASCGSEPAVLVVTCSALASQWCQ